MTQIIQSCNFNVFYCIHIYLSFIIHNILEVISTYICTEPLENVGSLAVYYTALEPLRSESRREPCDEQIYVNMTLYFFE